MPTYPAIVQVPANNQAIGNPAQINFMNPSDILNKKDDGDQTGLQSVRDSLVAELNALQHELRRVKDALERVGGASHDLERRALQLSENIQLSENDLKKHRG